jgi:small subunit ribosomal protein S17
MKVIRFKIGTVSSVSGAHTARVEVTESKSHPKYKKRYKRTKGFLAHFTGEAPTVGQKVTIVESRPLSARKRWRIKTTKA